MRVLADLTLTELRRFRGFLPMLSALFLICVPLLYGAIYLWSNWDPYGRIDQLQVGVVNLDQPVTAQGKTVHGGKDIVEQLLADPQFDWKVTDPDDAADGVATGRYGFSLTVPESFSADLVSVTDDSPRRARVEIAFDNSQGYILGIIAQTAEREIQSQLNAAAIKAYAESALGSLSALRKGLDQAAGAAEKLADGAEQVADGVTTLEDKVTPIVEGVTGALSDGSQEAVRVSAEVSGTARDIADLAASADARQQRLTDALAALEQSAPDLAATQEFRDLSEAVQEVGSVSSEVAATADRLAEDAGTVADAVAEVDRQVPEIVTRAEDALSNVDRLRRGADKVADGNAQLADGLGRVEAAVPKTSGSQRAREADQISNPVAIESTIDHAARYYGRGLAPFFFAISLWVFGLVAFVLMRPISPRGLASPSNPVIVAVGGWLPAALLGALGALLLLAVTDLALGLAPQDWGLTAAVSVLAVAAFTALAQLLRVALGLVGSAIMLVILIVQLGAAGGLYPVETMPGFFQVAHPLVPMTYLVDALRVTISGGSTSQLATGLAVLAGLLVGALALTSVVAWRQRRFTSTRLHPPLEA
jgi:putative membrane protein